MTPTNFQNVLLIVFNSLIKVENISKFESYKYRKHKRTLQIT